VYQKNGGRDLRLRTITGGICELFEITKDRELLQEKVSVICMKTKGIMITLLLFKRRF
jgi:hypothetical protein